MILAVETSFDETALALLDRETGTVEHQMLSSSAELHREWGGVVPELAARAHATNLPVMCRELLAHSVRDAIDLVVATAGPGLPGCLLAGVGFARGLALGLGCDYSAMHHLEGHLLSVFQRARIHRRDGAEELTTPLGDVENMDFPHLALIVSGGHTELVRAGGLGDYSFAGRTRDDAVGELLDKVGNYLGLGYPAGARLENHAREFLTDPDAPDRALQRFPLPVPMQESSTADFSFSGLKTAAVRMIDSEGEERVQDELSAFSAALLVAAFRSLINQTARALDEHPVPMVGVSGGVARNQILREMISEHLLEETPARQVRFPAPELCTDNASMIAYAAWVRDREGVLFGDRDIEAGWNLNQLC